MTHILKSDSLELHVDAPLEGYQFTRFDWTGKITQVWYRGIPLTKLEVPGKGDQRLLGRGFYNEFGIDEGLGFADANAGEWFHKIGVGALKKEGEEYQFSYPYELRPAQFKIEASPEQLIVHCGGEEIRGYAYALTKSIRVTEGGFKLDYVLRNTGSQPIITDEYVHNFLGFAAEDICADYRLNFPFILRPGTLGAVVNGERVVQIERGNVGFRGTPKDQFFYSELSANNPVEASWELTNNKLGIAVRETGDFQTSKINLWGWQHVVSPELFMDIKLLPGNTLRWSRSYGCYDPQNGR